MEDAAMEFFGKAGFEFWQTGGGCTAYGRSLDVGNDAYVLITDEDGGCHPIDEASPVMVGFYDNGHHFDGNTVTVTGFQAAVDAANRLVSNSVAY